MSGLDFAIMLLITGFLVFLLAYKTKLHPVGENTFFFDLQNTQAMRGFWCLIVVLAHVPLAYQNTIQDLLGSFANVGVTFFFMTSAYGLSEGFKKNPNMLRVFWSRRLPRLIIPNIVSNFIICVLFWFFFRDSFVLSKIFMINAWVVWLLICNLLFWLAAAFIKSSSIRDAVVCIVVILISILLFFVENEGVICFPVWKVGMLGFAGGILLSRFRTGLKNAVKTKWIAKVVIGCIVAILVGLLYLKYKTVLFWGDYFLKILLAIAILGFVLLLNIRISVGNRISLFLGSVSFEIYLIHGYVFEWGERMLSHLSSGAYILACLVITLLCSVLIHGISKGIIKRIDGVFAMNRA